MKWATTSKLSSWYNLKYHDKQKVNKAICATLPGGKWWFETVSDPAKLCQKQLLISLKSKIKIFITHFHKTFTF